MNNTQKFKSILRLHSRVCRTGRMSTRMRVLDTSWKTFGVQVRAFDLSRLCTKARMRPAYRVNRFQSSGSIERENFWSLICQRSLRMWYEPHSRSPDRPSVPTVQEATADCECRLLLSKGRPVPHWTTSCIHKHLTEYPSVLAAGRWTRVVPGWPTRVGRSTLCTATLWM